MSRAGDWLINPDARLTLLVSYQRRDGDRWRTVKRAKIAPRRRHRVKSLVLGERIVILTQQVLA